MAIGNCNISIRDIHWVNRIHFPWSPYNGRRRKAFSSPCEEWDPKRMVSNIRYPALFNNGNILLNITPVLGTFFLTQSHFSSLLAFWACQLWHNKAKSVGEGGLPIERSIHFKIHTHQKLHQGSCLGSIAPLWLVYLSSDLSSAGRGKGCSGRVGDVAVPLYHTFTPRSTYQAGDSSS